MVFEIGPDLLLTCPLDESHRILKSRLQFHLVKCLKNNKLGMRLKCPWNPLHIVDKFSYENHYQRECEDMPGAMESVMTTNDRDVGSVPVTATNALLPPSEEDWDAEPGPVGTYDPFKNSAGKPVLRIAIGLSKAKKKQYRQAERKRFQTLEENGPMQTNSRQLEDPKPAKELRAPLTISKTLSTNTSMIDDLNPSQFSEDSRNVRPEKKELRPPHKPSLSLSYKADFPAGANGGARPKSISSEDGARGFDREEVPNLCQSLGNGYPDNMSIKSSVCSYDPIEMARKFRGESKTIPKLNNSLTFSKPEKSAYFDDPTFVPNLIGPSGDSEDNSISGLSDRFAELSTMKKIDNKDAYMMQKMGLYSSAASEIPKLVGSTAALNLLDRNTNDDFPPIEPRKQSHNGINKCAANFSKLTRNPPQPTVGCGRGMVIAFDSFKDNKPGSAKEDNNFVASNNARYSAKVSTNPFEIPEAPAAGNISQQTYILSAENADEDDTDYDYEKAD